MQLFGLEILSISKTLAITGYAAVLTSGSCISPRPCGSAGGPHCSGGGGGRYSISSKRPLVSLSFLSPSGCVWAVPFSLPPSLSLSIFSSSPPSSFYPSPPLKETFQGTVAGQRSRIFRAKSGPLPSFDLPPPLPCPPSLSQSAPLPPSYPGLGHKGSEGVTGDPPPGFLHAAF